MNILLFGIPLPILLAILVGALAIGSAVTVVLAEQRRREVIRRVMGETAIINEPGALGERSASIPGRELLERIAAKLPGADEQSEGLSERLVRAGFGNDFAPVAFVVLRAVSSVLLPMAALVLVPRSDLIQYMTGFIIALAAGFLLPSMLLDRMVGARQERIRHGIPDTLDLLVVCLEAGVALDAAMQRVARELGALHPILAEEFVLMSRRISAGVPRELAMQGLFVRTGVEELRSLASNMVQSEKWGTSIVTVLRVYSEQLRRKRRMDAERRAATASTRMLLPLMLFIFPVIFVVLLGPAMMKIGDMFSQIGG